MILPGKNRLRLLGAMILAVLFIAPQAMGTPGTSRITDIAVRASADEVELSVNGAIEYGYFPLSDPERLVFDFPGTILDLEGGTNIVNEVEGAIFREFRLSQFTTDPPIARLVFYLTTPATPVVSFDTEEGYLLIKIITNGGTIADSSGTQEGLRDLFSQPTAIEEVEVAPARAVIETPEDPTSYYAITQTEDTLTIRFPYLTTDNIVTEQLRFPDRLAIRMLTQGPIDSTRPRFDPLGRGNIWNSVAKTWASYIDRDGRGVIDLTVYLYPEMGYAQFIDASGVPEIRVSRLVLPATPSETVSLSETESESVSEVEVSAFSAENETGETTELEPIIIQEAAPVTEPVSTLVDNEIEIYSEGVEPEALTETARNHEVNRIEAVETVEILEDATLITGREQEIETDDAAESELIAEAAMVPPHVGLPLLPTTIGQNNLLMDEVEPRAEAIYMRVGDVGVISVHNLVRASIGNPLVATLNVISQEELLITALAPGTTNILTWESGLGYITREINVLDATHLREEEIESVINDGDISVRIIMSGESSPSPGVVLEGQVETEEEWARAAMIASLYAGEKVTNLIEVTNPRQVLAQVRVVEINRRALDEHLSQFSAAARADNDTFSIGIITDLLDPENPGGGLLDSRTRPGIVDNIPDDMIFDPVNMVLNELVTNREATILSEPNLVAMSGHSATFRVGGEVPYTYQNENGVNVVEFKEFGISLTMTPSVDSTGNISMTLNPVVRTIDYALAIAGIPGFRTREMTTDIQLRPGETLVIGGLLQNEVTEVVAEIPILSQIPILGELFRSKRFNEDETELVIFITPHLIDYPGMSRELVGIEPGVEDK